MNLSPISPRGSISNNDEVQDRVNYHRRKRASTALVTSRILKAGLAAAFSYAAISQVFFLKQWANKNTQSSAVTDDDTPDNFHWQEGDVLDDRRASIPKEVKLFDGTTMPKIGSSAQSIEKDENHDNEPARSADNTDERHETRERRNGPPMLAKAKPRTLRIADNASNTSILQLLPKQDVEFLDQFSDSWLINKRNFMTMDVHSINFLEDSCFPIMMRPNARMTVDRTDFMVEHLSHWWKHLRILVDSDPSMFDHTIDILQGYILKTAMNVSHTIASSRMEKDSGKGNDDENDATTKAQDDPKSPLHPTIGIIPFMAYKSRHRNREARLSSFSLASTLLSLIQVGFGRILIVGYEHDDWKHSKKALELIASRIYGSRTTNFAGNRLHGTLSRQVGHTEIAYVKIPSESWVTTAAYKVNMQRGALFGMQSALRHTISPTRHMTVLAKEWLGTTYDPRYWKYFYLTEPDTILHTKKHLLPLIRDGLDKGIIYMPHRLQPLPHEFNLPPAKEGAKTRTRGNKHISKRYRGQYLPGDVHPFSNITFLDPSSNQNDHCCDAGKFWPGRSLKEFLGNAERQFPCNKFWPCGYEPQRPCNDKWWWSCGYNPREDVRHFDAETIREKHKRLIPYPMMSLESGTGIVFGPSEQGRRCLPSKKPCGIPLAGAVADERK